MIYLKNNTETQAIYIPRQTVLGGGYIPSTKAYEKGYNKGLEDGKEQQKEKLSSLHVAENGQYEREDGWNVVNVDVPDLNGSYNEGYEQGKTDGANEQKSKLETINITENGTYTKEDGYNHIEVNVPSYEEGQADMAANARVLNVTKNGTYMSKFSDPIPIGTITGVYNDGTKFNNYAELNGKVFNTKIAATVDSRLEFWYKGNNTINGDGWNVIIGSGNFDDTRCFQVRYFAFKNNIICIEGGSRVNINGWDDTIWHHLIVSKAEGIWVDGEKKGDFSLSTYLNGEFFINGIGYDTDGTRNANGTFGMIKIDDVVIIPTADGFLNTNTSELLEVVKDGSYTYTEGKVKYGKGELYKTINVNVPDLNGSYDEGYDNGYRDGYDAGQIKYNTIADIYGSPSDSTVTFKGLVALSFKYGSGKNILFTDHTGSIILKNCQEPLKVGDECLVTATLRRNNTTYISFLSKPSIEVLSSNNYVVMPTNAIELTNLDDLYIPNGNGYAEMKYLYADGTVVRAPFDNFMRIETRQGNISLRGNFSKWETKLVEGDNIRVYMFTENSHNVFFVTDIIKLEDSNLGVLNWTLDSPNPAQKNASDDGYDGYDIVVVRPENIIAQEKENAINDFKNKMDEITITQNGTYSIDTQETRQYIEFDGNSYFDTNIPFGENTKIEVAIINKFYKKEQIIGCAQYSLDEQSENYGGFGIVLWGDFAYGVFGRAKTNHIPSSIEEEEQILTLDRNGIHSSFGDGASGWIDDSGLNDSSMYGTTIGIGKINSVTNGWTYRGLNGRIRYVKIWTNKDDDSTLITYTPKTNGNFDANGVELQRLGDGTTTYVEGNVNKYPNGFKRVEVNVPTEGGSCNIQDSKWVRPSMADRRENGDIYIYPDEGFDSVGYIDLDPNDIYNEGYNKGLVDATPSTIGGIKFGNSTFEECTFNLEGIEDFSYLFENCRNLRTAPSIQKAIKNARNMFRGCSSLTTAPRYNTSEATDLGGMYAGCDKLTSVGAIDCSSLPNAPIGWNREAYIFDTNQYPSLTDFGGFLNLKQNVDLSGLIALSNNSVENIFNNLYNFSGNGETPNSIQGNITMSSFITDAVEQYRAIAESKGWTITIK